MRAKFKYLLLGLIIWSKISFCQTDSVEFYINKLDWGSFEEATNYFPQLVSFNTINKLIEIKDTSKIDKLVNGLGDPNKTVAIHIVLTKIFDTSSVRFGRSEVSKGSSTIQYMFNGLIWTRDYKNKVKGEGKVKKEAIEAIIKYWRGRLISNVSD